MKNRTFFRSAARVTTLACLFLVLTMALPGSPASASSSPMVLRVNGETGWSDNSWEDDNIAMRFSIIGISLYLKLTNKTQYVIRLQWPEAGFRLADGTLRTVSFIYEYESIIKPAPANIKDAKYELLKAASNEDLLIGAGKTVYLEIGVRVDDSSIPLKGKAVSTAPYKETPVAKADSLLSLLSMLPEGSFDTWLLHYDFAGKAFIKEVQLKLAD